MSSVNRPLRFKPWITDEDIEAVIQVLKSGQLSSLGGRWCRLFEEELARYLGVKWVVAVSSGSAALYIALKSLGIGPGDSVIVPAFTFIATATAVLYANAIPVFADIDRETLNIDPRQVEELVDEDTKGVIVVHIGGYPAEMDEIMRIAREKGIYVIEDTAQALGAEYRGSKAGSIGHVGVFSFYPTKTITTGEGGAIATNNDEILRKAMLIRSHGETEKYLHEELGFNFRMTEFQAALGLSQLRRIEESLRRREKFVRAFLDEVSGLIGELIYIPTPRPYMRHAWNLIQVLLAIERLKGGRDAVIQELRRLGFECVTVAYPRPLHKQPIFQRLLGHGRGCPWKCAKRREVPRRLPNAEWACERVISILVSPLFTEDDGVELGEAFKRVLRGFERGVG